MSSVHENAVNTKQPSSPVQQFYRRPLPQECISFCSDEGKAWLIFLCTGYMQDRSVSFGYSHDNAK